MSSKISWFEQGRGRAHMHVATLGNKRVEVSPAPPLYGRWMVDEPLPGYAKLEEGQYRPERNHKLHAYANDLKEARGKAEQVLRGESVERSPSTKHFARPEHPKRPEDAFGWERVSKSSKASAEEASVKRKEKYTEGEILGFLNRASLPDGLQVYSTDDGYDCKKMEELGVLIQASPRTFALTARGRVTREAMSSRGVDPVHSKAVLSVVAARQGVQRDRAGAELKKMSDADVLSLLERANASGGLYCTGKQDIKQCKAMVTGGLLHQGGSAMVYKITPRGLAEYNNMKPKHEAASTAVDAAAQKAAAGKYHREHTRSTATKMVHEGHRDVHICIECSGYGEDESTGKFCNTCRGKGWQDTVRKPRAVDPRQESAEKLLTRALQCGVVSRTAGRWHMGNVHIWAVQRSDEPLNISLKEAAAVLLSKPAVHAAMVSAVEAKSNAAVVRPLLGSGPPISKLREALVAGTHPFDAPSGTFAATHKNGPAVPHKGGCANCGKFHSLEDHNRHQYK